MQDYIITQHLAQLTLKRLINEGTLSNIQFNYGYNKRQEQYLFTLKATTEDGNTYTMDITPTQAAQLKNLLLAMRA